MSLAKALSPELSVHRSLPTSWTRLYLKRSPLGVLSFPEFMKQMIFAYILGLLLETILAPIENVIQKRLEKII